MDGDKRELISGQLLSRFTKGFSVAAFLLMISFLWMASNGSSSPREVVTIILCFSIESGLLFSIDMLLQPQLNDIQWFKRFLIRWGIGVPISLMFVLLSAYVGGLSISFKLLCILTALASLLWPEYRLIIERN